MPLFPSPSGFRRGLRCDDVAPCSLFRRFLARLGGRNPVGSSDAETIKRDRGGVIRMYGVRVIRAAMAALALASFAFPAALGRERSCALPTRLVHVVDGVTVTSYWTVRESVYAAADPDASATTVPVIVNEDTGEVAYYTCIAAFLQEVQTEGWGETLDGEFLGWWDGAFHLGPAPLDAQGNELIAYHTVAVDPGVIPLGAWVAILLPIRGPYIPPELRKLHCRIFHATDTGVEGPWVDVYVGDQYVLDMNETPDAYFLQHVRVLWSLSRHALRAYLKECIPCPRTP